MAIATIKKTAVADTIVIGSNAAKSAWFISLSPDNFLRECTLPQQPSSDALRSTLVADRVLSKQDRPSSGQAPPILADAYPEVSNDAGWDLETRFAQISNRRESPQEGPGWRRR